MNKGKFLFTLLCGFTFVMLINGLAFAEHECTRQVVRSEGDIDITTDCSASYSQTSENFTNRFLFSTLISNLRNNVNWGLENLQDRLSEIFSNQDKAKMIAHDLKEREEEAREAQQIRIQGEETQIADLKDRQEVQKERQESMQDRVFDHSRS
jgi:hypothetical protein